LVLKWHKMVSRLNTSTKKPLQTQAYITISKANIFPEMFICPLLPAGRGSGWFKGFFVTCYQSNTTKQQERFRFKWYAIPRQMPSVDFYV